MATNVLPAGLVYLHIPYTVSAFASHRLTQFPRFACIEDTDARTVHHPRRQSLHLRPNRSLWQCSTYLAGKNRHFTTKEESFSKAKEIAEDWYLKLRAKLRSGEIKTEKTFREVSEYYLHEYEIMT